MYYCTSCFSFFQNYKYFSISQIFMCFIPFLTQKSSSSILTTYFSQLSFIFSRFQNSLSITSSSLKI
ncbi:MAG: hypothetical protein LBC61_01170 [Candidatus Peribacteria bacterium]|nr:hypothetical protein [Candidatus Peribacteria bacterium]